MCEIFSVLPTPNPSRLGRIAWHHQVLFKDSGPHARVPSLFRFFHCCLPPHPKRPLWQSLRDCSVSPPAVVISLPGILAPSSWSNWEFGQWRVCDSFFFLLCSPVATISQEKVARNKSWMCLGARTWRNYKYFLHINISQFAKSHLVVWMLFFAAQ